MYYIIMDNVDKQLLQFRDYPDRKSTRWGLGFPHWDESSTCYYGNSEEEANLDIDRTTVLATNDFIITPDMYPELLI